MTSKLAVNFRTLIAQCEEMVAVDKQDWRLKKYIRSLNTMLSELEEDCEHSELAMIDEYKKRFVALKQSANYVLEADENRYKLQSKHRGNDTADDVLREVRQINNEKYQKEQRSELFNGNFSTIRRRAGQKVAENLEQTVKQYSNEQERLAEDMLRLTRNLKEQTETANKIIKNDTEVLMKSSNLTDKNTSALKKESGKLQESSKKACKCWLWMMIAFVMMVFIFMVMFMKIMKKKAY
ncbi:vesicle transport protein USE1 [Anopheles bellator]|uniref:vesicle transport protein USE1 n=1 Tax=Anopheles bellator TaxID=139047 RepID=UPI002649D6BB|nr:vesicle transport protein USE1 [Anopheles bellator]